MDCSSITDFQQSTAIRIAKKFRNLHIGKNSPNCLLLQILLLSLAPFEPRSFSLLPTVGGER